MTHTWIDLTTTVRIILIVFWFLVVIGSFIAIVDMDEPGWGSFGLVVAIIHLLFLFFLFP